MSTQPGSGGVIPQFTMGDRLRKAREVSGLGYAEFADELGISRNTVTNYERGHTNPRRIVLLAWSMRTGVPLEWIMTGEAPAGDGGDDDGVPAGHPWRARRDSNPQPSDLWSSARDLRVCGSGVAA